MRSRLSRLAERFMGTRFMGTILRRRSGKSEPTNSAEGAPSERQRDRAADPAPKPPAR
jgi:hypothetical protein